MLYTHVLIWLCHCEFIFRFLSRAEWKLYILMSVIVVLIIFTLYIWCHLGNINFVLVLCTSVSSIVVSSISSVSSIWGYLWTRSNIRSDWIILHTDISTIFVTNISLDILVTSIFRNSILLLCLRTMTVIITIIRSLILIFILILVLIIVCFFLNLWVITTSINYQWGLLCGFVLFLLLLCMNLLIDSHRRLLSY